jgi:hypothetical protein
MTKEQGSNVYDTSGNGYNATSTNLSWADGTDGTSGSFNGTSSIVNLTSTNLYNSLATGTISAWVYWNGTSNTSTVFDAESNNNNRLKLSVYEASSTNIDFQILGTSGGTPQLSVVTAIHGALDTWHHLVYQSSNTGNALFVDDVQATSGDTSYIVGASTTPFLLFQCRQRHYPLCGGLISSDRDYTAITAVFCCAATCAAYTTGGMRRAEWMRVWL